MLTLCKHIVGLWGRLKPKGWRHGIMLNAFCATIVLGINLGTTIWAFSASSQEDYTAGRRELYEGSCSKVKALNIAGHVLINALSTILLSASNYCMQCLTAPNRKEVDSAHAKRKWLDIGTPSLRNLVYIAPARLLLWVLLVLSSLPLHLLYNSALFSSIHASEYVVLTATDQFTGSDMATVRGDWNSTILDDLHAKAKSGRLERLENADCIAVYGETFQSTRANLVIVIEGQPDELLGTDYNAIKLQMAYYSFLSPCGVSQAFDWLCSADFASTVEKATPGLPLTFKGRCGTHCEELIPSIKANASSWTVHGKQVKYCLSEPAPDRCKLYFLSTIAIVVNAINVAKVLAILLVLLVIREQPLLTLGDAIRSFTETPDETTKGLGPVSRDDFMSIDGRTTGWPVKRCQFDNSRKRWLRAVGMGRIVIAVIIYLVLIAACAFFLAMGHIALDRNGDDKAIWEIGFGKVDGRTLITGTGGPFSLDGTLPILKAVLLANIAQPLLSGAYFVYNSIFTSFAMAAEWDQFALTRKDLRVSSWSNYDLRSRSRPDTPPASSTSSPNAETDIAQPEYRPKSHLLQLPYRFAVPLIAISGLLHWLASQSIFLVDIERALAPGIDVLLSEPIDDGGYRARNHSSKYGATCGYSPLATLCLLCLGLVMVGALLWASFGCRFETGMPVAGNCSGAIAAACHLQSFQRDGIQGWDAGSTLRFQYGEVVTVQEEEGKQSLKVGLGFYDSHFTTTVHTRHCGFSTGPVRRPVPGVEYE